jgi:hypothetical protein
MKKQNQTCFPAGRKLRLNKKTISNLTAEEMSRQVGGDKTKGHTCQFSCPRTCLCPISRGCL